MEAKAFISDKLVCTVYMTNVFVITVALSISITIVNNANVFPFWGVDCFPFMY
jgi:hypothetical protein